MLIQHALIRRGTEGLAEADLRIQGERIVEIAPSLRPEPGEEVVEAAGARLYPGFVDPTTVWGINGSTSEVKNSSEDNEETSDPITPELMVFHGFNGRSMTAQQLGAFGITACGVMPTDGNLLGGQIGVFDTDGIDPLAMTRNRSAAMKASVSSSVTGLYGGKGMKPMTKMQLFAMLRQQLERAAAPAEGPEDVKTQALAPVLRGEMPLFVACDDVDDRERVWEILKPYPEVSLVFTRGTNYRPDERWISDPARKKPSIIFGFDGINQYPATRETEPETLLALHRAGIPLIPSGHGPLSYGRENLLWSAIHLVRATGDGEAVLTNMTKTPAELLGIGAETGTIAPGKLADLVLWSGDPLETYEAKVLRTVMRGRTIYRDGEVRRCYY